MSAIKNHMILRLSSMGINELAGEFVKHSISYMRNYHEHHNHVFDVV